MAKVTEPHKWDAAEREWMEEYVPGHHRKEIAEEHNRLFPRPVTTQQVATYIKNHHLNTCFTGRFETGHNPQNKGKKVTDEAVRAKILQTAFKKGNRPHNWVPVGTEVISTDGYVKVKVGEPNKWEWKARMVWEAAHGPRPKGHVIIHINGISTDDRLENLDCIPRKTLPRMNKLQLMTKGNAEINETVIMLAKMQTAIGDAKKQKKCRETKLTAPAHPEGEHSPENIITPTIKTFQQEKK